MYLQKKKKNQTRTSRTGGLSSSTAATPISLAELLADDPPADSASARTKPRHRWRDSNGKRIRGTSRRWQAIRGADLQTAIHQNQSATDIGARPPAGAGLWAIDLANANSFATATDKVLRRALCTRWRLVHRLPRHQL